jgi:hypothetical protein
MERKRNPSMGAARARATATRGELGFAALNPAYGAVRNPGMGAARASRCAQGAVSGG